MGAQDPEAFCSQLALIRVLLSAGPRNVALLWKRSHEIGGMTAQIFSLNYIFGMPEKALSLYLADNSGFHSKPSLGSSIESHTRVDYQTHLALLKFANGIGLSGFYERWRSLFTQHQQSLGTSDEWVEKEDLLAFLEKEIGSAVVEATWGPIL